MTHGRPAESGASAGSQPAVEDAQVEATPVTPGSLRLFVAIELSDAWRQALGDLQAAMRRVLERDASLARVRVRWVRPEGIHLTLKFLGQVAPDKVAAIEWALESAVTEFPQLELTLARAGSFSDRRAPSVIWSTVHIAPNYMQLHALFERIETWLAAAGFPRERRSFAPHLTLARLPQDIAPDIRSRIAELTTAVPAPKPAPLAVRYVSLMRSHIGPGGARYEQLAHFPR